MRSLKERILEKIEMVPFSGCWIWTGSLTKTGYAKMGAQGKAMHAHRVAYETFVSQVPSGLYLDHLCRVRCCVNPNHLEPVTPRENSLRGQTVPARNAAKTKCIRGHAFTYENTYLLNGHRQCKACNSLRSRNYKIRKESRRQS